MGEKQSVRNVMPGKVNALAARCSLCIMQPSRRAATENRPPPPPPPPPPPEASPPSAATSPTTRSPGQPTNPNHHEIHGNASLANRSSIYLTRVVCRFPSFAFRVSEFLKLAEIGFGRVLLRSWGDSPPLLLRRPLGILRILGTFRNF